MQRDPDQGSKEIELARLLVKRFPHLQLITLRLMVQGEAFRDLCEEYATCTAACERLEQPGADAGILREYHALRLRLEGELLWYISQHGERDGRH